MHKKWWVLLIPVLVLALILPACGAKDNAGEQQYRDSSYLQFEATTMPAEDYIDGLKNAAQPYTATATAAGGSAGEPQLDSLAGRKLIKDVTASVETKEFDQYLAGIMAKTVALGGHVSSKDASDGGYYNSAAHRYATLVLRVPADKLDEFQTALEEHGKVTNLNESVRDVTAEYTDVEAHIKALRTEREALMKLMEQVDTTEEILQVRQQLTQVRYELDALEGQMRLLEDQITLSTVTLNIREVERITETKQGFWAGAWEMFTGNLRNIGRGFRDFTQGFLGGIPYLLLLAIPAALVIWLLVRRRKKRKAKKAAAVSNGAAAD